MKKWVMFSTTVLPFVIVVAATFYLNGIKKFGSPSDYREQQEIRQQAIRDSLQALKIVESPDNIADSTLFGMSVYTKILDNARKKEEELKSIQTAIDSLRRLKTMLEEKAESLKAKEEKLEAGKAMLQDENVDKMASLYNNMKTQMAVPLFLKMDDTLAVKILSKMEQRTAAKLLGAIGESDVNKGMRLNKLLSMDEVAE